MELEYDWLVQVRSDNDQDTFVAIDGSPEDFNEMAVPFLTILNEIYDFSEEDLIEVLDMVRNGEEVQKH